MNEQETVAHCAIHIYDDLIPGRKPLSFCELRALAERHGGKLLPDAQISAVEGGRSVEGEIIISTACSLAQYQEIVPHELVHRLADTPRWEPLNYEIPFRRDRIRPVFLEAVATKVGKLASVPPVPFEHESLAAAKLRQHIDRDNRLALEERQRMDSLTEEWKIAKAAEMDRRRILRSRGDQAFEPFLSFAYKLESSGIIAEVSQDYEHDLPYCEFMVGEAPYTVEVRMDFNAADKTRPVRLRIVNENEYPAVEPFSAPRPPKQAADVTQVEMMRWLGRVAGAYAALGSASSPAAPVTRPRMEMM